MTTPHGSADLAPHGPGRGRSADELRSLAADASARLAGASAQEVLAWASEAFGRSLVVACSMAGDTVVAHAAAQASPGVDVLFLQTGYHFAETIGTRDALAATVDAHVIDVLPRQTVTEQDGEYGVRLYERDPSLCCALRKVEPINRELASYEAWVTGLRREDSRCGRAPPWWSSTRFIRW